MSGRVSLLLLLLVNYASDLNTCGVNCSITVPGVHVERESRLNFDKNRVDFRAAIGSDVCITLTGKIIIITNHSNTCTCRPTNFLRDK